MAARLGGRYELGAVLGAGGMAQVYAATDLALGRQVAVKVLDPALARDPEYVARFAREARTAAMLPPHAGIVGIYDSGQDQNAVFLVMELVTGRTVAQQLAAYGPLAPAEACRISLETCEALAVAHGAGLIHRDVKPGNIMLTDTGAVKVVDFGIARAQAGDALTRTGAVIGSPAYMAPEQITGSAVDTRADLYALGVVLYEMLTGAPPFTGADNFTVLSRHLNEIPTPLSALRPGIPAELDQAIAVLLAKDPAARPASAEQAAQLLMAAAQACNPGTDRTTLALSPRDAHPTRLITPLPESPGPGHRAVPASSPLQSRTGLIAAVVIGALALVGIAIWALLPGSGSTPTADAAAAVTGSTAAVASATAASSAAQITVPTESAASPSPSSSPSPSLTPSTTTASAGPAAAIAELQQTVTAQASAGALDANAQQNLDNQIQNMQQIVTQAQTQASQNPQNQTQIQQETIHQLNDQIRSTRQQLANLVQHGDATSAASTAITSALDQLQQTLY
jgi:serine/threonine-protein kinase